ncbi:MAG: hypothetical protein M3O70_14980 [Actinomycetota bacterium]|nr:hypothetical protein [Actinomycetota bacterium]
MPKVHIEGWLNSDNSWTYFQTARTKNNHGNIIFNPDNLPNGGLGMSLRNDKNGKQFAGPTWWDWYDYSEGTVATDVLPGTRFTIIARRRSTGKDRYFSGDLYY